jgi:hypothetical protein
MAKIVLLLCAAVLSSGSLYGSVTPASAVAFAQGFLQGVEANPATPSLCAADLSTVIGDSQAVIADLQALAKGTQGAFTQLVLDLQKAPALLEPVAKDCDFAGLKQQLTKLFSPAGYSMVLTNYMKNMKQISQIMIQWEDTTDPKQFGIYTGQIFHYLVGWSLNGKKLHHAELETELEAGYPDVSLIVQGFLNGVQTNPTEASECLTDSKVFFSSFHQIFEDAMNTVMGKSGALAQLMMDLKSFSSKVPNFAQICNLTGLAQQIEVLLSPNGFTLMAKTYFKNQEQINNDLITVKACSNDYYSCGQAAGDVVKVLLGWSI